VAAEVELLALVEELVHVGIAAGAEQVVAATAVRVAAVLEAVADRQHRPEVRQARPEPVERREMRPMKLARARGPEALPWISQAPDVEVRHLRPLHGHDAEELTGTHGPRPARAPGDDEPLDEAAPARLARAASVAG